MLLKQSPLIGEVWLAHDDGITDYPQALMMDAFGDALRPLSAVVHQTDLLIEMNAFIDQTHTDAVRRRGGKCVSYRFGNDYVIAVETINFEKNQWRPNEPRAVRRDLDQPAAHAHVRGIFPAVYRAPVIELPHIWSPYFIERSLDADPELKARFGYRNHGTAKRRVLRTEPERREKPIVPMLAANACYVEHPGSSSTCS